jgi:hypothetical protein
MRRSIPSDQLEAVYPISKLNVMAKLVDPFEIHSCKDGSVGAADILGWRADPCETD